MKKIITDANILLIDDNEVNLEFIQQLLKLNNFKHIHGVNSATLAYAYLKEKSADLIILDLVMPGIDGISACKTIKSNPKLAHIPIIIATTVIDLEVMELAFEAGVEDYVRKPLQNDLELVLRISKALTKKTKANIINT